MKPYQPIPCELYSEYELVIIRHQALRVSWHDRHGVTRIETLRPRNLRTRTHQEFMIARTLAGERRVLRLDRIQRAEIMETGTRLL